MIQLDNPFRSSDLVAAPSSGKPKTIELTPDEMKSVQDGHPTEAAKKKLRQAKVSMWSFMESNKSIGSELQTIRDRVKALEKALAAEQDRAEQDFEKSVDAFLTPEAR